MTRKKEEEVVDEGGHEGGGEGGEGGGEEGGESLEDVVARWEATLGPKYKIIVSTSLPLQPSCTQMSQRVLKKDFL